MTENHSANSNLNPAGGQFLSACNFEDLMSHFFYLSFYSSFAHIENKGRNAQFIHEESAKTGFHEWADTDDPESRWL